MANLSNINDKLVLTIDGAALINQGTVDYGTAKLQVSGNGSTGTITWRNDGGRKTGYLYSDSAGVAIYSTALANAGIYLADNVQIDFRVNGSQRMIIDSSGNVGIGVTPNANWNTLTSLQIKNAALSGFSNSMYLTQNVYYDGAWKYIANDFASKIQADDGITISVAGSGSANTAISFVNALTISNSGNSTFAGIVGMGSTGIYAGVNAQLNLPGRGIAIKNDKNGSDNNWSYIYNTGTSSQANLDFVTGIGTALTLNHDKSATFAGGVNITGANNTTSTLTLTNTAATPDNSWSLVPQYNSQDLQLLEDASTRVTFKGGGKVIVGTDSSNALEVFSSGDTEIGFSYASHGNVYAKIIGDVTQASPLGGELAFQTATGGSLSESMRIDSSGRVGIGMTPSDYAGYPLQLYGGSQTFMTFGNDTTGTGALNGLIIGCDSTGADIYQREAQPLRFSTSNAQRMVISSLGVVSIGTTSPITDPFILTNQFQQLQVGRSGLMGSYTTSSGETMFSNNIYVGSTHNTFQAIDTAANGTAMFLYNDYISFKIGTTAGNGTVGVAEKLRITSTGFLNLYDGAVTLNKSDGTYIIFDYNGSTKGYIGSARQIITGETSANMSVASTGDWVFGAGASLAERMRITSTGNVDIGTNPRTAKFKVATNNVDYVASLVSLRAAGVDCYGFEVKYQNATPNGTGNHFAFFHDSTGEKCSFPSNGGIRNFQTNDVNISDRRTKEDIKDAPNSLDIISQLKVRNYKLKNRSDERVNTGLIAQEVEEVCKELVNNSGLQAKNKEDSSDMKGIYNTDLMFMMLKSIQELKAEIELLKNK